MTVTSEVGDEPLIMLSGGQGESSSQKVTPARCTQSDAEELSKNRRVSTGEVVVTGVHTRTRESQEAMVGSTSKYARPTSISPSTSIPMACAPILHCGQLNITISALINPSKSSLSPKSKLISTIAAVVCNVSS